MRARIVMSVAVVLTAVGITSGSTVATGSAYGNVAESRYQTTTTVRSKSPGVVQVVPEGKATAAIQNAWINGSGSLGTMATEPPSCWTHFAPPWPGGIAMTQYYRNCNGFTVRAAGGYQDGSGIHLLTACWQISDGGYIFWDYSSTNFPGANFSTFAC